MVPTLCINFFTKMIFLQKVTCCPFKKKVAVVQKLLSSLAKNRAVVLKCCCPYIRAGCIFTLKKLTPPGLGCHGSDPTFDSDFCNMCSTWKMIFGGKSYTKTENLFLITLSWAFYSKKSRNRNLKFYYTAYSLYYTSKYFDLYNYHIYAHSSGGGPP